MPGSNNLFDGVDLSNSVTTESKPRTRGVNTLQIHHATTTSFNGLKSLMDGGGRRVSANGAMSNTGWLDEVIPLSRRAFTSATAYDNQCLTVEVCNTTLGPGWGISEACRIRLARLAVDMFKAGMLGGLSRAYIIGHSEVPGTYSTACPGPDMHLDHIVRLANQIYAESVNPRKEAASTMFLRRHSDGKIFLITPNGSVHITSVAHVNLFKRLFATWPGYDTFNDAEGAIIDSYVRAAK